MAKTIMAIAHQVKTLSLIQQSLQDSYHVWACNSLEKALDVSTQGIKPQLLICPLILDREKNLNFIDGLQTSRLKHTSKIVFATKEEQASYPLLLTQANKVLKYPFHFFDLLRATDALLITPHKHHSFPNERRR